MERERSKEKIQPLDFRSQITCWRPGGNDTALVAIEVKNPSRRKIINDAVMGIYPDIEQVGFVYVDNNEALNLMMAGGEFCGNATRSTAYLALGGKGGEIMLKVSGVDALLKAGVAEDGEAYAQMPVYPDLSKVQKDFENKNAWIVEMEGITHLVDFDADQINGLSDEQLKQKAMLEIQQRGLDKFPASGIIYVKELENGAWQITPVVYVRDIDTLFLETACGSGTCALGQVMAVKNQASISELPISQPSGEIIKISIVFDGSKFKYAQIKGKVERLSEGIIRTDSRGELYVIENLPPENLQKELRERNLISLYQEVFADEPYWESFTPDEVANYFGEYSNNGVVLLAKNEQGIIGFAAALPLNTQKRISQLAEKFGIDPTNYAYIAELGVKKDYRRRKIGQSLIEELLLQLPLNTNALLRTTKTNQPAISLYQKLGFYVVPGMSEKVTQDRVGEINLADERIFLIKNL